MNDKHDITVTFTAEVTAIFKAEEFGDYTAETIERRFMHPYYAAILAGNLKGAFKADHIILHDLKFFIHNGNDSGKEAAHEHP